MSTEINSMEKLEIDNSCGQATAVIDALTTYINQLNKMLSVESMHLAKISLTVDGETAEVLDEEVAEFGNTYVMTDEGFGQRQMEHIQWNASHPLMATLAKARNAHMVEFFADFSVMALLGADYGISYWRTVFDTAFGADAYTQYKAIEYYDCDEGVQLVSLTKDGISALPFDAERRDVEEISSWFDYNFQIMFSDAEDLEEDSDNYNTLMELAHAFGERHTLLNEPDEPYEGDFMIEESFSFKLSELDQLLDEVTQFMQLCEKARGEFSLHATFIANDEAHPQAFAAIELRSEDGTIKPYYCKF